MCQYTFHAICGGASIGLGFDCMLAEANSFIDSPLLNELIMDYSVPFNNELFWIVS